MTPVRGQTVADWVVDKAALKLRSQIDAAAPNRRKDSDGTKGDPAHAARESAHNPEDSGDATAPGNPDNQVDAVDITHDPANGCDIGVFWENIRASRDMRAKFFIFNRRCFSNYNHAEGPAFTWRPYRGENPHDKHGHGEIDDRYHDQVHDWKIGGPAMFLAAFKVGDKGAHVQFVQYALYDLHEATRDADTKPLYPGPATSPTLPSSFTAADGQAMRRLLQGGDGINFTPLLAKRLMRKLGALDAAQIPVPMPGVGVTEAEARQIAENVLRHASISPAQEATPR